ncbi:MAG TPA: LytTR family DNA-binding domain-containing protein [Puia sp.]|nr:LytTR family DNA-binding domain-containing protein [Puia sp.]
MLNCLAVDDERLVLDLLVDNIRKVPFLQLAGRCKNAMEAAEAMQKDKIDLLFLDIQMPGLSGLKFMETLYKPPMVIFVTAYKDYAFEGFNVDAVDYLLKPVSFERFLRACNKAHELFNQQSRGPQIQPLQPPPPPDYFFVFVEYQQVKVMLREILYIEGMKDYVKIFLASSSKPVITKMSLKALEEKLSGRGFIRTHKSYILSADKVTAVKRDLVCIGPIELPLSESYRAGIDQLLSR